MPNVIEKDENLLEEDDLEYALDVESGLYFKNDLLDGWQSLHIKKRSTLNRFLGRAELCAYSKEHAKKIYLNLDESLEKQKFKVIGDSFYIHVLEFQNYFNLNKSSKIDAFLINHENIGKELREDVINNATAEEITKRFFELFQDKDSANVFLKKLSENTELRNKFSEMIESSEKQVQNYIAKEGVKKVLNPLTLEKKEEALNLINIDILNSHLKFIQDNLEQDESFFRDWLTGSSDENGKEITIKEKETDEEEKRRLEMEKIRRKSRCLIFGLDYTNYKTEVQDSGGKRLDLLTSRIGGNAYVTIEMKSPNVDIFKIETKLNNNGGQSTKYRLSDELARAIPQVLWYRRNYENSPSPDIIEKAGIENGAVFDKCIILIGKKKSDEKWMENFILLKKSLSSSLEIWTYTDLIEKLETTIQNLNNNL